MCDVGRRCAGHTGKVCAVALAEYHEKNPFAPDIDPLVLPETNALRSHMSPSQQDLLVNAGVNVLNAHQDVLAADAELAALEARQELEGRVITARLADVNDRRRQALVAEQSAMADRIRAEDVLLERTLDAYEAAGLDPSERSWMRRHIEDQCGRQVTTFDHRVYPMHTLPEPLDPDSFPDDTGLSVQARLLARNDPAYTASYEAASRAATAHEQARAELTRVARECETAEREAGWDEQQRRHQDDRAHLTATRDAAAARLRQAQTTAQLAAAQVAAGIDSRMPTWMHAAELRAQDVVVNPDGTTNLFVYRDPDDTHPDGSFEPVARVSERPGAPGVYQFDMPDGSTVTPVVRETYQGRTVQVTGRPWTVALANPQPGARQAVPTTERTYPFSVITDR